MIGRRATGTETHQAEDVDRGRRGVRPAAPIVWGLAAAALFGASTPIAKTLLATLSPWTLAGLLYVGAAAAVLPFAFRGGSPTRRRDAANLRRLAGAVLFGGVLGPVALLQGLTRAPAASVALWLNLETAATALFAWLVFREHLGRRGALANLAVVIAGAMLVGPAGADLTAAGWVGLAALCWGLDNNLTALIDGYTPAQSTLAKGVAAGGCNLVIAGWRASPRPPRPASRAAWPSARPPTACRCCCTSARPSSWAPRAVRWCSPPRPSSASWWPGRCSASPSGRCRWPRRR
ncbi:MAG: DMT family transporter [Myxococcales bacterium]|nr:DMT family transporter [Myxococcales bacterium]